MARLRAAIDQFNGALLCDDVGMGKTYVAVAVAQRFERRLVVAPAALESMWRAALATTATVANFVSFEALSRSDLDHLRRPRTTAKPELYDLVIVDEAHHARNPATNRYFALASFVRGARVLLLSATPIHNRRSDMEALLSLFLGSRARTMTSAELALCVVRREHVQLEGSFPIPTVAPVRYHQLPDEPRVVDALMNLPAPLPTRDGGQGGVLIGRGLVHQWASSEAALAEAVRRRIARAAALTASLEAGTYPTARELETWIYGDGALQLGFPELLSAPIVGHGELLDAVRVHFNALVEFRARLDTVSSLDADRANTIARIRNSHPGARIVAFAQYSETVSMLFRRLAPSGRVAMLTSHGARVAGGALTRSDAIGRFAPRASGSVEPGPAEAIDVLLTTDLLSEGINLQDASVVVHLDMPWTLARMEQRVGRVARMGSSHAVVWVHLLRPPRSAAEVLRSELVVRRKWDVARISVGTSAPSPLPDSSNAALATSAPGDVSMESAQAKTERLRSILQSWITVADVEKSDDTFVATVNAPHSGFIAAISTDGRPELLVEMGAGVSTGLDAQITACRTAIDEVSTDSVHCEHALRTIRNWFTHERASTVAGVGASSSVRRKQITSRIDLAIQDAPPHLRSARSTTAARARRVATMQQCAAVERELDSLSHSELPADEWLETIAALDSKPIGAQRAVPPSRALKIHALLLMRSDAHSPCSVARDG